MSKQQFFDGSQRPEDALRLTLTDGSIIQSPEFLHIITYEQDRLIVGVGQDRAKSTVFKGIIRGNEVDSVREVQTADGVALVCWLNNKSSMGFAEGHYLLIKAEDRPGFWCAGKMASPTGSVNFKGILTRGQIAKIEKQRFDVETAAWIIVPAAIVLLAIEAMRGSLGQKVF